MADFTYQSEERSVPLETYEWDRTWFEHTENTASERVFYIGDSISWGIRPEAQKTVGSEFLIDAFATSKAVDNPFLLPTLDLLLRQGRPPALMLVNSGLHGWHLEDNTEYAEGMRQLLRALKERCPSVAVVLTTCVADPRRNERVKTRNDVAQKIAEEMNCPILDFYSPSLSCTHTDGVHFNGDGYRCLANILVSEIRALLN